MRGAARQRVIILEQRRRGGEHGRGVVTAAGTATTERQGPQGPQGTQGPGSMQTAAWQDADQRKQGHAHRHLGRSQSSGSTPAAVAHIRTLPRSSAGRSVAALCCPPSAPVCTPHPNPNAAAAVPSSCAAMAGLLAQRASHAAFSCPAARGNGRLAPALPVVAPPRQQATAAVRERSVVAHNNWRTFGPSAEHSDGDAEYYQLTNRLSQQYEWFAPRPGGPEEDQSAASPAPEEQQASSRENPAFGLSERQIRALGLAGPQANMPDPVRGGGRRGGGRGGAVRGAPTAQIGTTTGTHHAPPLRCPMHRRGRCRPRRTCAATS